MSLESTIEADDASYGEVLGQYFDVAVEISWLIDESGKPKKDQIDRYERLCEMREDLRARLDEIERDKDLADIKTKLDQALQSD